MNTRIASIQLLLAASCVVGAGHAGVQGAAAERDAGATAMQRGHMFQLRHLLAVAAVLCITISCEA